MICILLYPKGSQPMKNIAILGFGTVGSGVAKVLTDNCSLIADRIGEEVRIKYILDLREFPDSPFADRITHDYNVILNDPDVSLVAEMMGGSHPAYEFTKSALAAKKSVVTSNKEVVANFGTELLKIAKENRVSYMFEASVGGGIPIIRPLINDLAPNKILSVSGILNGTTNYILTQMIGHGESFDHALAEAQKKGFAEADPSADVDGLDAARKIAILSALSYGALIPPDRVHTEGIRGITEEDVRLAHENGYAIKLIGKTELSDGKVLSMVSPRFVPLSSPLASVGGVFNGVLVDTDMVGEVMFYGQGAGKLPTAGAVCADIVDILSHRFEDRRAPVFEDATDESIADFSTYVSKNCFLRDGEFLGTDTLSETDADKKAKHLGARRYRIL